METGKIDGIDLPVSQIVLGSMAFSTDTLDDTFALLDAFMLAGGTCIDTAHVYGGGKSERAIGEWFANRGNRGKVVLLDKGAHHDSNGPRVTPECIVQDITESLDRLQTEYIDLYLLHRDDPSVPVDPLVECLNEQRRLGRIRAFGGSNWTTDRLLQANAYASKNKLTPFVASSPHFSLAVPSGPMWPGCIALTPDDCAWYEQHKMPVFAWSSQASGFFTGRYTPQSHTNADVERIFYSPQNWERLKRAQETGEAHGVSANVIALAYVLRQPFPVFALIGPRTVEELRDSLAAQDVILRDDELRYLEA